ncbi:MAG: glycosyltransferase family 4 protein [Deltaproteobacteria bacterium]|nr:glycosyltransferase family 4 protein [Deltaproteobacteria bacterium]
MRVLQLVSAFAYSGPAAATMSLCQELRALGHDVVIGHDTVRPMGNEHEEGMGPAVAAAGIPVARELALSTRSGPLVWLRDRAALRARFTDVDVVHAHFSHDHALAVLARSGPRPVLVRTVHSRRSLQPRVGQRWLMQRADAFIVHARARADEGAASLGIPLERMHVIRGPVDVVRFHADDRAARRTRFRAGHAIPPDAPLLLMTAIFQAGRGHERVLRAWPQVRAAVPSAQLAFAGLGELRPSMMELARGMEGVQFLGYLKDELPDAYAAADASILLALGNDGYGRAVLESMACGTPAAVPDLPEVAEVVAGTGAVWPEGDDDAQVGAVVSLLRAGPAVEVCRAVMVQRHAPAQVARETEALYRRLLETR